MNARASEAQKRKKMMRKLVAETAILEHDYSSLSRRWIASKEELLRNGNWKIKMKSMN
jgi:hypothetical protein